MKNTHMPYKTESEIIPKAENQRGIENHRKAASHFEAAAKSHMEAVAHHQNGNHEKAAQSTAAAHGHSNLGCEAQKEDAKQHALKG